MAKEIKAVVKVQIQAGKANPAPPVGPALAQHGLNIAEFCQKFNEATKDKMGYTIPAEVTIYKDRSYTFKLKTPLASELIKKAAGVEKGSGEPNKKIVGKITKAQLKEIAQMKLPDLNTTDIEQAMKIIAGTAKNSGIEVKD
ncbi:MAG: 50S ribosomal protein L11 [Candidatus Staskawiczbacteria bacterium RIFCSPHIGHO2_12_FULL_38_11]|uniref:Large ribosomal subunit protein uL11 n=1 Tax=Candidatus Staskawiczbacteria bacterium RIFCSPHIGHO2_12_FULL_38_11 TaxID=1802209 RepID=A0A1G2I6E2_9BACT|nr:MAG: 50S ribosomal protein L11 [Candidatus Staskawiczbacteria bacterium RIFCSPHIGHO2_12_FULL_38_11]